MDVPGVPESITRAEYLALMASVGFSDLDHLRSLEFRADGVYAEVIAQDEAGRSLVDHAANDVAVHKVYVPVKD
jgi:hypothetical protein